jgi:tripartite-type tricarboxylate transporter receptor subunit TctC
LAVWLGNGGLDVRFARLLCPLLSAVVAAVAPAGVQAQSWAKQPLRILVPVPAGGQADIVARLIGDALRADLGQPIVVENRSGATGRIAVDALKSATPDGATLLFAPIVVPVIGPLVFKRISYDPARDLVPVTQVARYEFAFAVAAHHPARTVPEFVAWAKANPAQASFGSPGAGSLPHFLGVMLAQAAGVELVHVPYKGVAPLEAELMSGQIAAGISASADVIPLHRAGKLRILGTSGRERSPLLPAVPTFRQQGYPAVEAAGWHGVYAPAGTPKAVIDRLSMAIVAAVQTPELRRKLGTLGVEPTGTTPETLAAIMAADAARWAPIIKASGFSAD